jgi:hypothetical protein
MTVLTSPAGVKRQRRLRVLVNPAGGSVRAPLLSDSPSPASNMSVGQSTPHLHAQGRAYPPRCPLRAGRDLQALPCIHRATPDEQPSADTTHRNHAQEIAQALPLVYDAVVCVSGDGLLHEVYNGLAQHATPTRALRTPLAPVPAGSGNGTILNLLGLEACSSALICDLPADVRGSKALTSAPPRSTRSRASRPRSTCSR